MAMRILVATEETQGRRPNDFCFAEEGEIVTFSPECTSEEIDGPCGSTGRSGVDVGGVRAAPLLSHEVPGPPVPGPETP